MAKTFERKMEELTKRKSVTHKQVVEKIEGKKRITKRENLIAKTKRRLYELYHGKKAYAKKKFKPTGKRK